MKKKTNKKIMTEWSEDQEKNTPHTPQCTLFMGKVCVFVPVDVEEILVFRLVCESLTQ